MINTNQIVDQYYESSLNEELFIRADEWEALNMMYGDEYREVSEGNRLGNAGGVDSANGICKGQYPVDPEGQSEDYWYPQPISSEGLAEAGIFPF